MSEYSLFIEKLKEKRLKWIEANRENEFEEGIQRLLTDLYPDKAHFIFELLQNAEDAQASKIHFKLANSNLTVTHNGKRPFNEKDVNSITSIGNSTKADDINQIGKFGVGFKAVFSYSASPRIYSEDYCFEIRELVCPYPIESKNVRTGETCFEFPFNHPKKPPQNAFNEILKGLTDLKDNVLLFLSNIKQISIEIDGAGESNISSHVHNNNLIEIRHRRIGEPIYASSYWLRFISPIAEGDNLYVAVAFGLGFKDKEHKIFDDSVSINEQMEIIPVEGQLSIFFPAEKEITKLKFHIHAPYSSTVARDSIPYNNENKILIEKTAVLLSKSLFSVKEMGLLTISFLETLPNNKDELNEFYRPLLDKVIETMHRSSLVPTYEGDHAPASDLLQGLKDIKEVITDTELPFFTKKEKIKWVTGVMQNSRADDFIKSIKISDWKWKELVEAVKYRFNRYSSNFDSNIEWLRNQSEEWMQRFYALLENAINNYENENRYAYLDVANWIVIRTSLGEHVAGNNVYFPSNENEASLDGLTRVKPEILQGRNKTRIEKARRFLERAGVKEAGEREEIQQILKSCYETDTNLPSDKLHLQHIKRFVTYWKKEQDSDVFDGFFIFKNKAEGNFYRPESLYIDQPYSYTGLSVLYSDDSDKDRKQELWHGYKTLDNKEFISFAVALGAMDSLRVEKHSIDYDTHPDGLYFLMNSHGKRSKYEENEDYSICNLKKYLSMKSKEISLLVWNTMRSLSRNVLQARYCRNSGDPYKLKPSTLVYCLRKTEWIPAKEGKFYKPSEISKEMLPTEFICDDGNGWLTAIGFSDNVKKHEEFNKKNEEMAKLLGIPPDIVELFNDPSVSEKDKIQIVTEIREAYKRRRSPVVSEPMPTSQATDLNRRREKALEQTENAVEKSYDERIRTVRVSAYSFDPQAKEYLRNHNRNENGNVICQLCDSKMPFKLNSGDYFEAVQFIYA